MPGPAKGPRLEAKVGGIAVARLDHLQRRGDHHHRPIRRGDTLQDQVDHRRGITALTIGVIAPFAVKGAILDRLAGHVIAAAGGIDQHAVGQPRILHRLARAHRMHVPVPEDGAKVGVLLQDGCGDLAGLLRVPVRGLVRHDLDLGMRLEDLEGGLVHDHAVSRGQLARDNRHLARLAAGRPAFGDDIFGDLAADPVPVGPGQRRSKAGSTAGSSAPP